MFTTQPGGMLGHSTSCPCSVTRGGAASTVPRRMFAGSGPAGSRPAGPAPGVARLRSVASAQWRSVASARLRSVASARLRSVASARWRSAASARLRSVASARLRSVASARLRSVTALRGRPSAQGASDGQAGSRSELLCAVPGAFWRSGLHSGPTSRPFATRTPRRTKKARSWPPRERSASSKATRREIPGSHGGYDQSVHLGSRSGCTPSGAPARPKRMPGLPALASAPRALPPSRGPTPRGPCPSFPSFGQS